jgi:NAD-dependent SIR2 family protein deacetylase
VSGDRYLVMTGAGASVESGVPAYRTPGGLWRDGHPALRAAGIDDASSLCDPAAFAAEDTRPWAWGLYQLRLRHAIEARPHAGHEALRHLELDSEVRHVTTNVDGLLQDLVRPSAPVLELHGTLRETQCGRACGQPPWPTPGVPMDRGTLELTWLPECPSCGGHARPRVLMFGWDLHWDSRAAERGRRELQAWLAAGPVTVLEVGAGHEIGTLRGWSRRLRDEGHRVIRVNPDPGREEAGVELVRATAAEALPALLGPAGPARPGRFGERRSRGVVDRA